MKDGPLKRYGRFIKFCIVGGSGVFVNMLFYYLFTRVMGMGDTLGGQDVALVLSIEISIITNFILNDLWTFNDRKQGSGSLAMRVLKFHAVCLLGSLLQWGIARGLYRLMLHYDISLLRDIEVLGLEIRNWDDLLTVFLGIVVATFWNFFVNLYWTWRKPESQAK